MTTADLASVSVWLITRINNLPSHLRQVVHHVTPPISNSPMSDLSTSLFLSVRFVKIFKGGSSLVRNFIVLVRA